MKICTQLNIRLNRSTNTQSIVDLSKHSIRNKLTKHRFNVRVPTLPKIGMVLDASDSFLTSSCAKFLFAFIYHIKLSTCTVEFQNRLFCCWKHYFPFFWKHYFPFFPSNLQGVPGASSLATSCVLLKLVIQIRKSKSKNYLTYF